MFDNFNVNLRKNEGFLTSIPCIPLPDYGQSNAPLHVCKAREESGDRKISHDPFVCPFQNGGKFIFVRVTACIYVAGKSMQKMKREEI